MMMSPGVACSRTYVVLPAHGGPVTTVSNGQAFVRRSRDHPFQLLLSDEHEPPCDYVDCAGAAFE